MLVAVDRFDLERSADRQHRQLSGFLFALLVIFLFINGVILDIQFRGGAIVTYSYTGDLDADGMLHREGMMRRATAADEIVPLRDPRVQSNAAYLIIILLSRVITSLGDVAMITPQVIENLFVEDLNYLQALYKQINTSENPLADQTR